MPRTVRSSRARSSRSNSWSRSAIPMAVHVGFAEPEAAECEHAGRHAGIVQPDVPRSGAVDPHIGLGQQLLDIAPCTVIPVRSLRWNQTFGSAHGQCILDRFGGGLRQRPQSGSAWSGSAPSAGDRSRHAWRLSATGRRLTVEPMLSGTRARKKLNFLMVRIGCALVPTPAPGPGGSGRMRAAPPGRLIDRRCKSVGRAGVRARACARAGLARDGGLSHHDRASHARLDDVDVTTIGSNGRLVS